MVYSESLSGTRDFTCHPGIAVVGIGNVLLSDEGVGVHVVHRLARIIDRQDVAIIDAGTSPELFFLTDGSIRKLVVIDAAKGGEAPGSVYRFNLDELEAEAKVPVSLHDLTLLDHLRLLNLLKREPMSIVVIGIEPKVIDFGIRLSSEVEAALPKAIELVLKEIEEFSKQSTEVK